MRLRLLILLLALSCWMHRAEAAWPPQDSVIQAARRIALDYLDAAIRADADRLGALLDDTFQMHYYQRDEMKTFNKLQLLSGLHKQYPFAPRFMKPDAILIEAIGQVVIVKAVTNSDVQILTLYIRGGWRRIIHSTIQRRSSEFR